MAVKYTKTQVMDRLRTALAQNKAILTCGAGTGLSAKCEEKGGVDVIVVYNSGYFRMNGHPSTSGMLPLSDANALVCEMGERMILPVVKTTPVVAGVFGVDPTRDMRLLLKHLSDIGYSGVINFPTIARIDGTYRRDLEQLGFSFSKEAEMIKLANSLDMFTMAYVFTPEEAKMMAEADVDVLIPHCGTTSGGYAGVSTTITMDEAIIRFEAMYEAGTAVKKDLIVLCHGGPIATYEDVALFLSRTKAVGFVAASSIERLPVETAMTNEAKRFKTLKAN